MHVFRLAVLYSATILAGTCAHAAVISSASVVNTSSANDATAPTIFETQSFLLPVLNTSTSSTLQHRMAFVNSFTASGGAAQVHKRNVNYQLDFTVNDVTNSGFSLDIVSFLSGISSIAQTSETGTAFANGAHFAVGVDDSTDAPDTYSNLTSLFNDTNGVTIVGNTSAISAVQNTENASLGSFVGTTTFSLRFTTVTTPTTNILFGNGRSGTGQIDYGLGNLGSILSIDPEDLGHFITITVSFDEIVAVPEPSSAILLTCSGIAFVFYRRRRT